MTTPDQQLEALAPNAGVGVGKLIASDLLARPGFIKKCADVWEAALNATRRTWDQGNKCWVEEPDTRSQLQALFGLLAHTEGEPIKRIIHEVRKGVGGSPDEMLAESPAAIEAAKRIVAGAEARRRKAGLKKAEPVEIDVEG